MISFNVLWIEQMNSCVSDSVQTAWMLHRYPTDTIQGQADSYSGHACWNKMLILPKRAKMLNDVKAKLCTYPVISEDSAQCLTLNDNSKMTSIILSKSSITEQSPLRLYFLGTKWQHTHIQLARQVQRLRYFLLQVLRTFVFNQAATEQRRPSLRSKLCCFFRSSLITPGPVFMVSASVYRVFLDKCQPVTFFEVIYSPQKADAVPGSVRLCSLVRWSFTAIILYISRHTRTSWDECNHTHYTVYCVDKTTFLIKYTELKK